MDTYSRGGAAACYAFTLSFMNSVQRFFTARQVSLLYFFSPLRQSLWDFCTRSNLPSQFSVA
jgi:hypothetical protein